LVLSPCDGLKHLCLCSPPTVIKKVHLPDPNREGNEGFFEAFPLQIQLGFVVSDGGKPTPLNEIVADADRSMLEILANLLVPNSPVQGNCFTLETLMKLWVLFSQDPRMTTTQLTVPVVMSCMFYGSEAFAAVDTVGAG
jgi:hypothetical protein